MGGAKLDVDTQEIRLPDGVCSIRSVWSATLSNVTDKFPGPCPVSAGVQVDACPVVAPAVAGTQNCTSRITCERLRELGQRRLCAEAPAIDLVGQVRDVLPVGTSVLALEHWEVIRVVARQRRSGDDSTIFQLCVTRVGDALITGGLVDGVVREKSPWSWLVAPAVRLRNCDLRQKRRGDDGEEHPGDRRRLVSVWMSYRDSCYSKIFVCVELFVADELMHNKLHRTISA